MGQCRECQGRENLHVQCFKLNAKLGVTLPKLTNCDQMQWTARHDNEPRRSGCKAIQLVVDTLVKGDDRLYNSNISRDQVIITMTIIDRFASRRKDQEMFSFGPPEAQ